MSPRVTDAGAVCAALLAFVLSGTSAPATLQGGLGVLLLLAGLRRRRRALLTVGCAGLFGATLYAGATGAGGWTVVAASGAAVVAWTAGQTSVELETALPEADVRRLAFTHLAGTTALVSAAAALALVPQYLDVTPSPLGLVLVLFGAVALTTAHLTR